MDSLEQPGAVLPFVGRIRSWISGHPVKPVTLDLELTYKCNHKCPWCAYAVHVGRDGEQLPFDIAIHCLEWAKRIGASSVILSGGGEPSIYSKFGAILDNLNDLEIDFALFTNGSTLGRWNSAYGPHLRHLRISLDAATGKTHADVHGCGPRVFEGIVNNVATLKEERPDVTIGLSFVVSPANVHEISCAATLAGDLEVDYVLIKRDVSVPVYSIGALAQIEAAMRNPRVNVLVRDVLRFQGHRCRACWSSVLKPVVTPDGHLQICCSHRSRDFRIGDLRENSIDDLWGSERHRKIWNDIDISSCPECRLRRYNEILHYAVDMPDTGKFESL